MRERIENINSISRINWKIWRILYELSEELKDVETPSEKEVIEEADVIKNNAENENHSKKVSENINLWKNYSKRFNRKKTTSKRKDYSD